VGAPAHADGDGVDAHREVVAVSTRANTIDGDGLRRRRFAPRDVARNVVEEEDEGREEEE